MPDDSWVKGSARLFIIIDGGPVGSQIDTPENLTLASLRITHRPVSASGGITARKPYDFNRRPSSRPHHGPP